MSFVSQKILSFLLLLLQSGEGRMHSAFFLTTKGIKGCTRVLKNRHSSYFLVIGRPSTVQQLLQVMFSFRKWSGVQESVSRIQAEILFSAEGRHTVIVQSAGSFTCFCEHEAMTSLIFAKNEQIILKEQNILDNRVFIRQLLSQPCSEPFTWRIVEQSYACSNLCKLLNTPWR